MNDMFSLQIISPVSEVVSFLRAKKRKSTKLRRKFQFFL